MKEQKQNQNCEVFVENVGLDGRKCIHIKAGTPKEVKDLFMFSLSKVDFEPTEEHKLRRDWEEAKKRWG